jgi:hypothetical protein
MLPFSGRLTRRLRGITVQNWGRFDIDDYRYIPRPMD